MGRTPCCDKNGLKKGPWTPEEDHKLVDYIQKHGYGNWRTLPKNAGLQRCGKSCRLRWTNYLRPDIKRGRFSFEEEEIIIQLHSILGNKWSAIAARLPGRTDNEIKNYWNTHIRKRLLRMGIDPVTHSPRLDLLDLSSIFRNSLYNSSQMNLSAMLGVNPQLLRLATSLVSSHQSPNPQNTPQNHQAQFLNQVQEPSDPLPNNLCMQNLEQHDFSEWDVSGAHQDYVPTPNNYCYYNSSHVDNDQLLDNSILYNNNNLSAFPTPSTTSSPTPLNSNSTTTTHVNGGSATEDEREIISYCNDMLKFQIPDILDVSDFPCNF